jgi:hypothetical protein
MDADETVVPVEIARAAAHQKDSANDDALCRDMSLVTNEVI